MDKKPLIGISICAVVLLVLGSLSNVVGFQSVKSTVNDSPLFTTRTQRATNQQQNSITSQYLGMGKGNLLQFPIRDNRTEQLKKTINIISKMDDKTFERFTEACIKRIKQDKTFSNLNPSEIKQILYLLRTQLDRNSLNQLGNYFNITSPTIFEHTVCNWSPGCVIFNICCITMIIILTIIYFISIILVIIFPSLFFGCTAGCPP